jgi:phenylacetate-CoA ligase
MAIGISPFDKDAVVWYTNTVNNESNNNEQGNDSSNRSRGRESLGAVASILRGRRKNFYIAYDAEDLVFEIMKYDPKMLCGNPSYMRLVAEASHKKNLNFKIKCVSSWGEVLDEPTREYIEKTFQCPVFDAYGTNELGWPVAWECKKKEGLHIVSDYVILEVMKDGCYTNPGELGELYVTNLLNFAMPLIRYKVGDVGILSEEQCSCGRSFPLIKSIEGRTIDCIELASGNIVTPKKIMNAVQSISGIPRYQVVQEDPQNISISIMKNQTHGHVLTNKIKDELQNVLGSNTNIKVIYNDEKIIKAKYRPILSIHSKSKEPRWINPYGE